MLAVLGRDIERGVLRQIHSENDPYTSRSRFTHPKFTLVLHYLRDRVAIFSGVARSDLVGKGKLDLNLVAE